MSETTPISQPVFDQVVGLFKEQLQDPWVGKQFFDLINHDFNHLTQGNPHLSILSIAGSDCSPITELMTQLKKGQAGFSELKENLPVLFEQIINQPPDGVDQKSLDYIKGLTNFVSPIIDSTRFLYSLLQDQPPSIELLQTLAEHRIPASSLPLLGCQLQTDSYQEIELNGIEAVIVFNLVLNATNAHLVDWQGINTNGEQEVVVSFDPDGRITITNLSQRPLGEDNRLKLKEREIIYGAGFGLTIAGFYAALSGKEVIVKEEKLISSQEVPYYRISITIQPKSESEIDQHKT